MGNACARFALATAIGQSPSSPTTSTLNVNASATIPTRSGTSTSTLMTNATSTSTDPILQNHKTCPICRIRFHKTEHRGETSGGRHLLHPRRHPLGTIRTDK
jgi:hypothetical protein